MLFLVDFYSKCIHTIFILVKYKIGLYDLQKNKLSYHYVKILLENWEFILKELVTRATN